MTQHRPPYLLSKVLICYLFSQHVYTLILDLLQGIELEQMLLTMCCGSVGYSQGMMLLLCNCDQQAAEMEYNQEQVLYCYPDIETPPLRVSKGLFLTLLQLIPEYALTTPQM